MTSSTSQNPLSRIILTSISQIPRSTFLAELIPKTSHGTNEKRTIMQKVIKLAVAILYVLSTLLHGASSLAVPTGAPTSSMAPTMAPTKSRAPVPAPTKSPVAAPAPTPAPQGFFGFVFGVFDFFGIIIAEFFDFVLGIFGF